MIDRGLENGPDPRHAIDLDCVNHLGKFRGSFSDSSGASIFYPEVIINCGEVASKRHIAWAKLDSSTHCL